MTSLWCRDVTLGRQGAVALLTVLIAQWVLSTGVSAQTTIIPALSVSERYDSNVFYTPKSLLGPDNKPEDFITTVTPQIIMAREGSLVGSRLLVGALVSKYLNNPNLDYTGINAAGQLDLKRLVNKFSQRISMLSVRGSYQFTPTMSGFGATTGGGLGTGFGVTSVGTPLNSGLIANRVSMHNYTLGIMGGYALTRTTSLRSSYNYTKLSFGSQSGGVNNPLFGTEGHQAMTALSTTLTPRDSVGTTAAMSHYSQSQSTGGGTGSFTTITGTMNWARRWTQQMSTTLAGGGIVTLPVGSSVPGQSVKTQFAPTATARMNYSSVSEGLRAAGSSFDSVPSLAGSLTPGGIIPPGAYTASMGYTFSIFPSYAFGSGPMKTHVIGVNANGGITAKLTGQVGVNYSHSTTSGPSFSSSFDTVGLTAGARYLIGPVMASLSYNWLYFSSSAAQSLGQSEYEFSKKMVMLSFSYAFTSQSFFRMGGLGSIETQGSGEGMSAPSGDEAGRSPSGDGLEF